MDFGAVCSINNREMSPGIYPITKKREKIWLNLFRRIKYGSRSRLRY